MPKLIKKDEFVEITELSYNEIRSCPHVIFDPKHFHNNTCDCYDKNAKVMKTYGYRWNTKKGVWV